MSVVLVISPVSILVVIVARPPATLANASYSAVALRAGRA